MDNHEAIKAHLNQLYGELAKLSTDPVYLEWSYVAGGALVSLIHGEEPKDYDIWFRKLDDWEQAVKNLKLVPSRQSKYSNSYKLPSGKLVQLVKSRLGQPDKVVGSFDFKHTHCYYDKFTGQVSADNAFICSKRLEFVPGNLCHPVNTVQRVLKFVRRGYSVSNETIADLMNAVGAEYKARQPAVFTGDWGGSGDEGSR